MGRGPRSGLAWLGLVLAHGTIESQQKQQERCESQDHDGSQHLSYEVFFGRLRTSGKMPFDFLQTTVGKGKIPNQGWGWVERTMGEGPRWRLSHGVPKLGKRLNMPVARYLSARHNNEGAEPLPSVGLANWATRSKTAAAD